MMTTRYANGKIYKLVNNVDDLIYVGSTCMPLHKRLYGHKLSAKREPNRRVYKHLLSIGWDNVKIILIEECKCNSKMELERREREWIEKTEREKCLNCNVPGRTWEEYYQDNKDKIKQYLKQYREENKEKIKQYREDNKEKIYHQSKEYRLNNIEKVRGWRRDFYRNNKKKVNKWQSEKCECECGSQYTKSNKARHFKSKKHKKYLESQQ